jgi:nicotinamide-nucleotide amidase
MSGVPAAACLRLLEARRETVATAESLTAGLISAMLASVPGASAALLGGVAVYATESKARVLRIPRRILTEHGAVSEQCAQAMATSTRELFAATWGVSATGVAGPDRQEGHQVGTVFVGVSGPGGHWVRRLDVPGERDEVRRRSAEAALTLLLDALDEELPADQSRGSAPDAADDR